MTTPFRDPMDTLAGCERIVVVGRTGSGKTTFARELAAALRVPHVELDSLYFGQQFSTAPLAILRERTSAAIESEQWVTDGNKRAVRDLVWPRADTVIWLDYSLGVSLWRLAKRARRRTSELRAEPANTHLAVVRLRSPRAAREWLSRIIAEPPLGSIGAGPPTPRSTALRFDTRERAPIPSPEPSMTATQHAPGPERVGILPSPTLARSRRPS
ncbi:MAG: hypothetical protein H0U52_11285 [Chloroflexi bacterium]|nr:hypothetical protein [Chloroflexota bacterium]